MKRVLLVVPLMFAALLVLPSARAWACSCASATPAQWVDRSDVVLRGTLEDVDKPSGPAVLQPSDPSVTYRFAVSEVFRGEAMETTYVSSSAHGASCGLEGLLPGREYVVFAQTRGDTLVAGLCGGTAVADSELVADVQDVTGPGHDPVRPGLVDEAAQPPGAASAAREGAWLVPLVGGGVLALLLVSALVVVLRRGRRRA
jgi:hypothetical protein